MQRNPKNVVLRLPPDELHQVRMGGFMRFLEDISLSFSVSWCKAFNEAIKKMCSSSALPRHMRRINIVFNTKSGGCFKLQGGQINTLITIFLITIREADIDLGPNHRKITEWILLFQKFKNHIMEKSFSDESIQELADEIYELKKLHVELNPPPDYNYCWPNFDSCMFPFFPTH